MDPQERERRLQIALRLKAARHLAGHLGAKGATPMPVGDLANFAELIDEEVSANKLTEVEQMKATLKRSEMRAIIDALALPTEWFDGLYPSNRGEAVRGSLGELLQGVTEAVQAPRQEREEAVAASRASGRRRRATEDDDA